MSESCRRVLLAVREGQINNDNDDDNDDVRMVAQGYQPQGPISVHGYKVCNFMKV